MYTILRIELLGFYVQPYECPDPVVIDEDATVRDANHAARQRGVRVGMAIRQARVLTGDLTVVPYAPDFYEAARRRWLDAAAKFTGVVEPDAPHGAYLDLSDHPQPKDIARRARKEIQSLTSLTVRWGLAPTKWQADLAARIDAGDGLLRDPVRAMRDLPIDCLLPVDLNHRERLKFLGYRTIGEVAEVPFAALRAQFGDAAHSLVSLLTGGGHEPVQALYPPDSLSDLDHFAGGVEDEIVLMNGLRRLSQRIGERLCARDLKGQEVWMSVERDSGEIRSFQRTFAKPIHNPLTLFSALQLMFTDPGPGAITGVRVTLPRLRRIVRSQRTLESNSPTERRLGTAQAMRHVNTVYGDGTVRLGSEILAPRRRRVLRAWGDANGW